MIDSAFILVLLSIGSIVLGILSQDFIIFFVCWIAAFLICIIMSIASIQGIVGGIL